MGAGASSSSSSNENEIRLQEENQVLRRRLNQLNAQLAGGSNAVGNGSGGERSSGLSKTESKRGIQGGVNSGGESDGRRGEVSAETREVGALVANYVKVAIDKPQEIQEVIAEAVEASLLFNSMTAEEKSECVDAFSQQTFQAGDEIIKQGDSGNDFYVLVQGEVEIMVKPKGGKRGVSKGMLSEGQSFGELALLYNTPRAATIVARCETSVWTLTRDIFVTISTYFKQQRLLKYEKFLQKVDLFKDMQHEKLMRVAEALESEKHLKDEPIILQGEKGHHFYLIENGQVRYEVTNMETNEKSDVGTGGPGDCFGDKALIDDNDSRTASVFATTDVKLLCMERTQFKQLMKGLEAQMLTPQEKEEQLRDATLVGEKFRKEINMDSLDVMRTLGEGAFGRVRLVKNKESDTMYALKYLSKQHIMKNQSQSHVINERNIMMMIDNPFVLKLHNTYQDTRYVYFLVELIRGGELFTLLRDLMTLSEKMARFYAAGVIQGFEHMHERNICYRDLKPENLLLNKDGYIKIVDLGLSKVVPDRTWTLCGKFLSKKL
tara:strand:+ start:41 stop:1687 length:1647 start_codon:yes stop_codon:yes gene_type:complete